MLRNRSFFLPSLPHDEPADPSNLQRGSDSSTTALSCIMDDCFSASPAENQRFQYICEKATNHVWSAPTPSHLMELAGYAVLGQVVEGVRQYCEGCCPREPIHSRDQTGLPELPAPFQHSVGWGNAEGGLDCVVFPHGAVSQRKETFCVSRQHPAGSAG